LDVPDVLARGAIHQALKQFERRTTCRTSSFSGCRTTTPAAPRPVRPRPPRRWPTTTSRWARSSRPSATAKFWTDTCIFAIEDDPQNGWDHVSGYRTTAYVASAYTRRGAVVSTQYNQTSLLRTMELMLGLPPMNQMDATATPMFDCFTNTPDFTAFDAVTNNVPLDEMNPRRRKFRRAIAQGRLVSARLPLDSPTNARRTCSTASSGAR
jgi:hypothetical protein